MNRSELEKAIQDLLEGALEPSILEDLQRELRENGEAKEVYREYVRLHNALQIRSEGVDLVGVVPMERIVERRQRRLMRYSGLATAAVLVLSGLILAFTLVRSTPSPLSFRTSPGTVFELSTLAGRELPELAELEEGSRLQVRSGSVELEFASGVRGIVRGPADLTLEKEDVLHMARGTGWFEVPEKAVGFKVSTPDLVLTDLGTEFGILSQPDFLGEAHVFVGKVEVLNRVGLKQKRLIAGGEAWVAGPAGRWTPTPLRRDAFLTELPTTKRDGGTVLFEDDFRFDSSRDYACVDYVTGEPVGGRVLAINSRSNGVLELRPENKAQLVHRGAALDVGYFFKSDWLTQVTRQTGKSPASASQVLTDDPSGRRYCVRFRVNGGVFVIDFDRGIEGSYRWYNNSPYTAPETFWIERISETQFAWYRGSTEDQLIKIAEVGLHSTPEKLFVGVQAYKSPFRFDNLTVVDVDDYPRKELEDPDREEN